MNQKTLNVIFGVVVVVLIGVVVYFTVGKKSEPVNNSVVNNSINSPTNQITPTSPSVTANWNKYSNDKLGFEVKYPSGYAPHLVNATSGAEDTSGTKVVFLKTNEKIGSVPYLVVEYSDKKKSSYLSDPSIKLIESKNVTVDGISGTQDQFDGPYGIWTTVYLNKGGIIYSLTPNKTLTDFSQLLSTFKFTE